MTFLADEGIDGQIIAALRNAGHMIDYVAEMEPGLSDNFVLEQANQQGALLLTADKDFGELVFHQRRLSSGVILVRLAGLSPSKKAEIVEGMINKHGRELADAFSVITPSGIRIRYKRHLP